MPSKHDLWAQLISISEVHPMLLDVHSITSGSINLKQVILT